MRVTIDTNKKTITLIGETTAEELVGFLEDYSDYNVVSNNSTKWVSEGNTGYKPKQPLGYDPYMPVPLIRYTIS